MKKEFVYLSFVISIILSSCNHSTICKLPPSFKFDSTTIHLKFSNDPQTISPALLDSTLRFNWNIIKTPLNNYSNSSFSKLTQLSFIFNQIGTYQLAFSSDKSGCKDSVIINVVVTGIGNPPSPCGSLFQGNYNISGGYYQSVNDIQIDATWGNYCAIDVHDDFRQHPFTIYLPKTFKTAPLNGTYSIQNITKTTSQLVGRECIIIVDGQLFKPDNPGTVCILPGKSKLLRIAI